MEQREYIRIGKPTSLPNSIALQRKLNDDIWKNLVFYHLLSFYKNYDSIELKTIIKKEQLKSNPRTERVIAKYVRKHLNNNREFNLINGFYAGGELTNDEDVEGSYDITIIRSYWSKNFYFECKNLNKSQDLINKYVFYKMTPTQNDGGVYRYFNGKYAQNQNFGGMIGFVLEGDISTIKNKIKLKLNTKFDTTPNGDLLSVVDNSISNNEFTFNSIHFRKNEDFVIHHLLFDFQ